MAGEPLEVPPPGYAADLSTMRRLITRGVHSLGARMRFKNLKNKYPEKHTEHKAEGQGEIP